MPRIKTNRSPGQQVVEHIHLLYVQHRAAARGMRYLLLGRDAFEHLVAYLTATTGSLPDPGDLVFMGLSVVLAPGDPARIQIVDTPIREYQRGRL